MTMSKNNIDQILAALGDAIKGIELKSEIDYKELSRKFPVKSLTGDHIVGGKIQNFSSSGIEDRATKNQIVISDDGTHITALTVDKIENLTVSEKLKTKILEADEIRADIKFEKNSPIIFSGDTLEGKGLIWSGSGHNKQFVFASNPDRFFVSENLEFAKGKSIVVNNIKLIDEKELGPTVIKSNLQEVGRLKGLIVDGSLLIDQYIVYSQDTNRLGLGIEEPNSALSIAEDGIEVVIGTKDSVKGYVGTYASNNFDIVTDNTTRMTVSAGGNITLGNPKIAPVQVSVHGKLAIKVSTPDPEVDLHVNGDVKFGNRLQRVDRSYPTSGSYNAGDIVWNSEPKINSYVGWVCVQAGSPGIWEPFGKIGNS
jgi:hypothetical protein